MDDKTIYKDAENSFPRVPVTVEVGLLRVQNDSFSLVGVREAKLEVTLAKAESYNARSARDKRLLACGCGVFALFCFITNQYVIASLFFGAAVVAWYLSTLSRQNAEIERELVAKMILLRGGEVTTVEIGRWNQSPKQSIVGAVESLGYDADQWRKGYTEGWQRAKAISEAIGSAIKNQSLTNSL